MSLCIVWEVCIYGQYFALGMHTGFAGVCIKITIFVLMNVHLFTIGIRNVGLLAVIIIMFDNDQTLNLNGLL